MNIAMFGGGETVYTLLPRDGEQYIATFGGMKIDLSRLALPPTLRLSALAVFGGIEFIVPSGTHVVLNGFSFMGGRNVAVDDDGTNGERSVIYLEAVAAFGGISVREAMTEGAVYEAALP